MTFHQLRYFQATCRYGGVSKAAGVLRISQPSISNSIRDLEEEFGVALFLRQNKRLVLTKEGEAFLARVDALLDDADETERFIKNLGNKRTLVFGVPPMLSSLVTPVLYRKYAENRPDFSLEIMEGQRGELLSKLESHQISIALLPHDQPFGEEYCCTPVAKLQNVCCCSQDHKLADRKLLSVEDLRQEPLILFKNSFFQTQRILDRFSRADITPQILLSTVQVSTLQNMVINSLGIGFVYEFVLRFTPQLKGIPLDPPMFTNISLVWKRDGFSFCNVNKFLAFAKQIKEAF